MADPPQTRLTLPQIANTWWPLAASWLLMGMELPALSAIVARLADPEINLAAYGGVVFPLALIIESPIIMLLAASTALSKDWDSYRKIRKFMMVTSAILTGLHLLIALTPLYYFVVEGLIGAPQEIVEPARTGLLIMFPWTWAIAYRRFNQGMLIRFGHSRAISVGTAIRLLVDLVVLGIGFWMKSAGIVVATTAVAAGVVAEAVYVGFIIRPVIRRELVFAPPIDPPLSFRDFREFYVPLAMTSLITLIVQPIGSAALSRMPQALDSLAVWPVVTGFIFLLRGMGIAFNEVVVTLLDEPNSTRSLRRFTVLLTMSTSLSLLLVSATPLAKFWFEQISALSPALATLAHNALWLAFLLPGLNTLQSWYQGAILHSKKTHGITEAVIVFIVAISAVLWGGVSLKKYVGLYIGIIAFTLGMLVQTIWLWYRSRPAMRATCERDARVGG